MAFGRELPTGFEEAIKLTRKILSENSMLVRNGWVETEAEQIVIGAFRAVSGKPLTRLDLYARMREPFSDEVGQKVLMMAVGRREGRPLQYVIGYATFFDNEYIVAPGVLVPRPETEVLVEVAAETLTQECPDPSLGLEIGLGSGAISIELLTRFEKLKMVSSELTDEAAAIAKENADFNLGPTQDRLHIIRSAGAQDVWSSFDVLGRVKGSADFIISNPPYLIPSDPIEADVIAHEPPQALYAPEGDANFFYREIAQKGGAYLASRGFAFVEVPHQRSLEIKKIFDDSGWETEIMQDLTQRDRVLVARLKK